MKRFISPIILLIIVTSSISFAQSLGQYAAFEINEKIIFNGEEQKFLSPVVTINERVYIPLREVAENNGVEVIWNGDGKDIELIGNFEEIKIRKAFEELFGFSLPDTAEIVNHEYFFEYEEPRFTAKISFEKEDLEYIKNGFLGNLDQGWEEITNLERVPPLWDLYSWWENPETKKIICIYDRFIKGIHAKTVHILFYITEETDGSYYLYICR